MTTDFRTDQSTPGVTPTGSTPIAAPAGSNTTDQSFLEYNGRKLSQGDVATKLAHADQFIEQLKAEREADRKALAELAAKVNQSKGVDEVLAALKQPSQEPPKPVDENALVERAAALIADRNKAAELTAKRDANWKQVTESLGAQFGDKVNEAVAATAAQHGMTVAAAAELARSAPSAFLALFPKPSAPVSLKGGRVNTGALKDTSDGPKVADFFKSTSIRERTAMMQEAIKRASAQ